MKTVFKFKSVIRRQLLKESENYMEEKMKYSTRQQKMILECLQEYGDTFYTIDQFMEILRGKEIQIGRTTVYRGLERLAERGSGAESSVCGRSTCPVSVYPG